MNNYGMKISQAGYDVKSAAKERLIFSSAYDTFKVFLSGSGSITIGAAPAPGQFTTSSVSIAHLLGYYPAFFAFANNPLWASTDRLAPYVTRIAGQPHNGGDYMIDIDYLTLNFSNADPGGSVTFDYRYYIFYNQLG